MFVSSVVDIIILLALAMGAVIGYKQGFFRSVVGAVGGIAAIILAFYLKNIISPYLYTYLPFFKFGGEFTGLKVLNIFIYEAIAFLIIYALLMFIVHILINISKGIEDVLDFTVILGIPSKIFGAVFGFIETYCILFILLFVFAQFSFSAIILDDSKLTNPILNYTPVLSNITGKTTKAFKDVLNARRKYNNLNDKANYNLESIDTMLKYNIISTDNVRTLMKNGKLQINGLDIIVSKYEGEQND